MSDLHSSMEFLRRSDTNFLAITHRDGKDSPIGNRPKIYLGDIPGGDLKKFIKDTVGPITAPVELYVVHRKDVGTTHRKDDKMLSYGLKIEPAAAAATPQPEPIVQPAYPVPTPPVHHAHPIIMGNGGLNGGLGIAELVDLHSSKIRLEDYKRMYEDLKEEFKDLKSQHRTLEIEKREADSKIAIADQKLEMAVMLAKSETRSFLDSDALKSFIDNAPTLLAAWKGNASPQPGLGAPSDVSENVQEVMDYIAENCNDHQAQLVGSAVHFITNPAFANELQEMIRKYSTQSLTHANNSTGPGEV